MKKLHLILLTGAMAIGLNASAQFSNTTGSTKSNYSSEEIVSSYDRFQVAYVNEKLSPDKGDDQSLNGVGLKWLRGISLSKTHPIYVQSGIGVDLGFWSDEKKDTNYKDTYFKQKITKLSAIVPVNLAYKFNVSPVFSIEPLIGMNIKFNILANQKNSVDTDDESLQDLTKEEFEDRFGQKESVNLFDKKDTGDKNATWKRFQIGWHIGANFIFSNKYYAGISYGTDFIDICKKTSTSTLTVGLGYIF